MNVRAEFERNRFATVDETGCSILTVRAETFTTLELWLQSFRRLRLTSPNTVTRIATFVSLPPPAPPSRTLTCFRVSSSSVDARWYKVVSTLHNNVLCANSNLTFEQGT